MHPIPLQAVQPVVAGYGGTTTKYRKAFESCPESAAGARAFVLEAASRLGVSADLDLALCMTSELVSNSIQHAEGDELSVTVSKVGRGVVVEVADADPNLPVIRHPGPLEPHGRGIQIIQRLAQSWGVEAGPGAGKVTWFRLEPAKRMSA